jgi:hypothetical protein
MFTGDASATWPGGSGLPAAGLSGCDWRWNMRVDSLSTGHVKYSRMIYGHSPNIMFVFLF